MALAFALAVALHLGAFAAAATGTATAPPCVPGRLCVKFRAAVTAPAKASPRLRALLGDAVDTAQPMHRRRAPGPLPGGVERLYTFSVPAETDVPRLAAKLSRLAEVEYAEPVFLQSLVGAGGTAGPAAVPNDPQYPAQQAYLTTMQVEQAWDVAKGMDTSPIVCVVDGGTNWQHEDLQANMWVNPGEIPANGVDDDGNGFIDDVHGWDFRDNNGDPRGNWGATPGNANHGTHTAGLLAAVTHNAVGIACASWNPRLMAVNASGMSDNSIAYGFDGILYAADNGASVVSLSWGGFEASQAAQDIIDYAVAQGVLVIAAAGNNNANHPFYPAAYRDVYAVANVWGSGANVDKRYSTGSGSNYGGWIDVAAAGVSVYSTFDFNTTNQYGLSTGTSMSAPVAAAVAALIQSLHPTWGPLEVGEQLRVSCDNINAVNPGFADLIGKGRVNAFRAVTLASPAVRLAAWTFVDAGGNGELNRGENVDISLQAKNYLEDVTGLGLTLSSPSPYVTIVDGSENIGTLLRGGSVDIANAFSFIVSPTAPAGTQFDLRVDMAGTGYTDFQWLPVLLEPVVKTLDANNLVVSAASTGHIGWVGFPGGLSGEKGQGFRFSGGPNLLFEGALMLGTSATALSDAARTTTAHTDFAPANGDPPQRLTPGPRSDQEIRAAFTDTPNTTTPLGVDVELRALAYAPPPDDDFVFLGYQITNTNATALANLYVGLFLDWDIDEAGYGQNLAAWDASRYLGYAWNGTNPSLPHVGVMALSGPDRLYSAVRNDGAGQPVNVYNGLSKSEKWTLLQGTGITSVGPTDISNALSQGPYSLAAGDSVRVWFALLAGSDLSDLQWNADRAVRMFGDSVLTAISEFPPEVAHFPALRLALGPAVPNPLRPGNGTRLALQVDRLRRVQLGVFDVRGRLVRVLVDREQPPGALQVGWDGRDQSGELAAAGVYLLRLRSEREVLVRRLVLAR